MFVRMSVVILFLLLYSQTFGHC